MFPYYCIICIASYPTPRSRLLPYYTKTIASDIQVSCMQTSRSGIKKNKTMSHYKPTRQWPATVCCTSTSFTTVCDTDCQSPSHSTYLVCTPGLYTKSSNVNFCAAKCTQCLWQSYTIDYIYSPPRDFLMHQLYVVLLAHIGSNYPGISGTVPDF